MKKFIAILAVALLSFTGSANAQKYGHINAQEILKAVPGYDAASKEMERYRNSKVAQLQDLQKNVQSAYDKYMAERSTLSKEIQQSREKEISEMQVSSQEFEAKAQKKIEEKYNELMEPLLKQIQDAIKAVGKANGYAYIFDITQGGVVYFDGGNDVTPLVVTELQKNVAPAAPATNN